MTSKSPVGDIPVVTLIRTDTTLDHSQKAEKVWSTRLDIFDHYVCAKKTNHFCIILILAFPLPIADQGKTTPAALKSAFRVDTKYAKPRVS